MGHPNRPWNAGTAICTGKNEGKLVHKTVFVKTPPKTGCHFENFYLRVSGYKILFDNQTG
jgi:hypothetical protein